MIGSADGESVFLHKQEGAWSLPGFCLPPQRFRFFPDYVPQIQTETRLRWGIKATVLRHLADYDDRHFCELEVHQGSVHSADCDCRWVPRSDLGGAIWVDSCGCAVVDAWLRDTECGVAPPLQAPWERKGWYDEAVAWITAQAQDRGLRLLEPIEQIKGAWPWSSILRASTTAGRWFFKAGYLKPPLEVQILQKLSEQWPLNVPALVAADVERNWMLMEDFGTCDLEDLAPRHLLNAVVTYAKMQVKSVDDILSWIRLGVRDFSPTALMQHFRALLEDDAVLSSGPNALEDHEITAAGLGAARLDEACDRLASGKAPLAIMSDDFRPGNIVLHRDQYLFYDWANTVLAHPFFSISYFLNRLPRPAHIGPAEWRNELEAGFRTELAKAYLSAWEHVVPASEAMEELAAVRRLFGLYECIRVYQDIQYLEPGAPWTMQAIEYIPRCIRFVPGLLDT